MALVNAFGALALDQSVMAATPLLNQINTSLTATPYVYVVNPGGSTTVNFPGSMNVNVANPATPPAIQNVALFSTPVVISYQGAPYTVVGTVNVSNFPAQFNVNVANPSTPAAIQKVQEMATPITIAYQGAPYTILGTVAVSSLPAPSGITNVNVANPSTPPAVQNVAITSTPIVMAYQPAPYVVSGSVAVSALPAPNGIQNVNVANPATPPAVQVVSVNNLPAIQNVNVANPATPPVVQNVNILSTPIVYAQVINQSGSASNVSVTNQPTVNIGSTPIVYAQVINPSGAASNVTVTNFPGTQNVSLVSTPIVYAELVSSAVTVSNFPSAFNVSNFPGGFNVNNWPSIQNVNLANVSTPPPVQNTNIVSTPIVYAYQGSPFTTIVSNFPTGFNVNNWPATQNINFVGAATPVPVALVSNLTTPIVYAQIVNPSGAASSVSVTNFPSIQNVNLANVSTPPPMQNVNIAGTATPLAVSVINGVATPVVYAQVTNVIPGLFGPSQQLGNDGSLQGFQSVNISLYSTGAGTQATPLVQASGRSIRVINYAFTNSAAGTVGFTATPVTNFYPTGIAVTGINVGGPFSVAAQGGHSFSGDLQGPAFQVNAGTPLYLCTSVGNIGGHLTFVYV